MLRNIPNRASQLSPPTLSQRTSFAALTPVENSAARFTHGSVGWVQTDVTSAGLLIFQMPSLPVRGRLLSAEVQFLPVVHVAMPATKPQVQVIKLLNGFSAQLGATVVDPSTTIAQYNVAHSIVVPNLNFELTPDSYDFVEITFAGETGANSLANLRLSWVEFLIGVPQF